jgi:hypothetical protein
VPLYVLVHGIVHIDAIAHGFVEIAGFGPVAGIIAPLPREHCLGRLLFNPVCPRKPPQYSSGCYLLPFDPIRQGQVFFARLQPRLPIDDGRVGLFMLMASSKNVPDETVVDGSAIRYRSTRWPQAKEP